MKKYEDYDWKEMQESGKIKNLKVAVLDLFLKKHSLMKRKMKKYEKVQVINAWLSMQVLKAAELTTADEDHEEHLSSYDEEDVEGDTDNSDEDIVTHEIGISDSEEDMQNDEDDSGEQEVEPEINVTRSGRQVQQRKFFWELN